MDALKGVRHYRDLAVILLTVLVGLRRHEVLAVQVGDVDFASKIIRIKGKGRKELVMPLPAMVTSTLRKYLEYERPPAVTSSSLWPRQRGPATKPPGHECN